MFELRLTPSHESNSKAPATGSGHISEPERELNGFINSMKGLIGPITSESLTELWLDELACMECIHASDGFNWRLVSLSASMKLASRVIASKISGACF